MPILAIVAAALGFAFFSIVPTVTYLYVERRSRRHWMDAASGRQQAPFFVRAVAWWSLAIGQLSIPWLLVPAAIGSVLFMLAKIGKSSASGTALLIVLGVAALAQALQAFRLFPFAIRLLARDGKVKKNGARFAVGFAIVQALALGSSALTFAFLRVPGFLNPIVRTTVYYGAILPIAGFAALGLIVAALCAGASKALD